ncbi:trypsin-like peptidase domain-containing protein [Marine Group I thaumarchaeote]|uniref:Trypsin-like peptidase domain-containing protein n=1 Tax=Marine Group I thaumarchaeote TaxID=2511932 RepID=A0A7K4MW95_9ARCH|nr:trypsin-like peptidase domain-containing protein [Marine Group I thaumarchaeote]
MKSIKYYSLICFFILFVPFNISATENENVLVEARDDLKFESVIERAKKSVVLLSMNPNVDPETEPKKSGLCSGVVVDDIGHVLTNFHCVYKSNYIRLYYYDEDDWQNYEVNVIGLDPLADLALLKVLGKEEPIPHLEFAEDAGKIKAGTDVFALGHPMGMAWTVTKGIISSTERYSRHPFIKALQTDAAINKGNSGGPLMNMKGEIVGINALIISRNQQNAGVGLAIRGDIVKKSFESMLVTGRVDRPAVGIMIMPLAQSKQRNKIIKEFPKLKSEFIPNTFGVFVRPDENLPKGLKKFDTIIGVNDEMVNDGLQFSNELYKYKIGETITLTIVRKRRYLKVDVPLKIFPVDADAMYSKIKTPLLPKPIQPEKKP